MARIIGIFYNEGKIQEIVCDHLPELENDTDTITFKRVIYANQLVKEGNFVGHCSNCGMIDSFLNKYCPNCGAKMFNED